MNHSLLNTKTTADDPLNYMRYIKQGTGLSRRIDCCFIPTRNPEAINRTSLKVLSNVCDRIVFVPPLYITDTIFSGNGLTAETVHEDFVSWFLSLQHVALLPDQYAVRRFQLPLKRTYAVFRSMQLGYNQIMFLDDDILWLPAVSSG